MKTMVIQIGNSDDKLTQKEWSDFVATIGNEIEDWAIKTHFFASSMGHSKWQNACWVVEVEENGGLQALKVGLTEARVRFKQESCAITEGVTEFI